MLQLDDLSRSHCGQVIRNRTVYSHKHVQYIISTNIKSAICVETTAKCTVQKVTAYLDIK